MARPGARARDPRGAPGGTAFALVGCMDHDNPGRARVIARAGLLMLALAWGTGATYSMARFGWEKLNERSCRPGNARLTEMRLKIAEEATIQFMIEEPRCPKGLEELVRRGYLDAVHAKDAWGTPIQLVCPGNRDVEGCDAASAGPDREWNTADDLDSDDPKTQL
jgi:hypothetical protein